MKGHKIFSIIPYKDKLLKFDSASTARAYYRNYYVDLLSGEVVQYDFNSWIETINEIKVNSFEENVRVVHLFYELSYLVNKEFHFLNSTDLLVIDIQFEHHEEIEYQRPKTIQLKLKEEPNLEHYKTQFNAGYAELLKGNCYQFNLTGAYKYSFDESLSANDFIFSLWKNREDRGSYGSATFIPYFNKLFISNSPECLFQFSGQTLTTMPIKGTFKLTNKDNWKKLWKKLKSDKKSQGELFMIADLLRNDLSSIEFPKARIIKRKYPRLVPGLIHQYSQIEVELTSSVSLWRIIEKMFPGGSITGAPKKRAIRLLHSLENRERGFYCGSTLILHKEMKSASINIRSSEIDFENLSLLYQAGGGITLLSIAEEEFKEMTYKRDSFIQRLTP